MKDPIVPEGKMFPPDYADETMMKEDFIERYDVSVEDVEAALEWHEEMYGNNLLHTMLGLWHGLEIDSEKFEMRTKRLNDHIDEIVLSYLEEVVWPQQRGRW